MKKHFTIKKSILLNVVNYPKFVLFLGIILMGTTVSAAVRTTKSSGGLWSDNNTWQGNTPPVAGDDVVIANGDVLTVNVNISIANLSFGNNASKLNLNANFTLNITGNISYSSTTHAPFTTWGANSTIVLSGAAAQTITNSSANVVYTHLDISNVLGVTSGALNISGTLTILSGGSLSCGTSTIGGTGGVTINTGATFKTAHTSGMPGAITTTGTNSFSSYANYEFQAGVMGAFITTPLGNSINNLTINGNLTLSQNMDITGTLALNSGILNVADKTLVLSGNSPTRVTGSLDASNTFAKVAFTNSSAMTLPANFFTGTATDVTLNGAGGITLGSATTIGTLTLANGKITLDAHVLTVSTLIQTALSSYIVTNGAGALKLLAVTSATFPVGPSIAAFNPIQIASGGGVDYQVKVSATSPTTVGSGITQPTKVINRVWDITPTGSPTDVVLTFSYLPTEGVSLDFVPSGLMDGLHYILPSWVNIGSNVMPAPISGAYTVTFTNTGSTWSPFSFGNAGILGVEFQSLTAKANGTANHISWTTASEKDNATFSIERSNDGANFASIGTVKGSSTTATERNYSFSDDTPLPILSGSAISTSYYRIRQTDNNGATSVSKIVSVAREKGATARFYPSVSKGELTVEIPNNATAVVGLIDLSGRTVLTRTASGTEKMDVNALPNGIYFLSISIKGEPQRQIGKFLKN